RLLQGRLSALISFLGLFLDEGLGGYAGFIDDFLRLLLGLTQDFGLALFGLGEGLFHLFRIVQALLDLALTLIHSRHDRLEAEAIQDEGNDGKIDDLGQYLTNFEMIPGVATGSSDNIECVYHDGMKRGKSVRGTMPRT